MNSASSSTTALRPAAICCGSRSSGFRLNASHRYEPIPPDAEGRILFKNYPGDWEKYTLAFPVTSMPNVSGAGLMKRFERLGNLSGPGIVCVLAAITQLAQDVLAVRKCRLTGGNDASTCFATLFHRWLCHTPAPT